MCEELAEGEGRCARCEEEQKDQCIHFDASNVRLNERHKGCHLFSADTLRVVAMAKLRKHTGTTISTNQLWVRRQTGLPEKEKTTVDSGNPGENEKCACTEGDSLPQPASHDGPISFHCCASFPVPDYVADTAGHLALDRVGVASAVCASPREERAIVLRCCKGPILRRRYVLHTAGLL